MTQGKIERWHRTMKNVVRLENYYSPEELEAAIGRFVDYYNNERYHESLENVTPADVYFGRNEEVITRREKIKRRTLRERRMGTNRECRKYNQSEESLLKLWEYVPKRLTMHTFLNIISSMNTFIKYVIKFIGLYTLQIGALWGALEAYTYFQDGALKNILGPYWSLIYVIPIFTAAFILRNQSTDETKANMAISTRGDYSPGNVSGDYMVSKVELSDQLVVDDEEGLKEKPTEKQHKSIQTEGKYSPGDVGGDYTVEG